MIESEEVTSPIPFLPQNNHSEDSSSPSASTTPSPSRNNPGRGVEGTLAWTTDEESEPETTNQEVPSTALQRLNNRFTSSSVENSDFRLVLSQSQGRISLRSQIQILVERALVLQINENNSPYPRRPWFRRQVDTFFLRLLVFIMRYHKELCILFLLFVSGFASYRPSPIKTRATPSPKPFFNDSSSSPYLEDFYEGQYFDLVKHKIHLGPAFIFYYAPWDSESVGARNVFNDVAKHFYHVYPGRIRFYAVNCWWPQGECRMNYKTLSHFPIFVAHIERASGIIYSGPIRKELMIKFLTSILMPLTRIDTEEEIWRFRAHHDAIMLGYFNFTEAESAKSYETYLQMALRNFEYDPFGQVGFGILLRPELAEKYFVTSSNVISLVLFNEIHTAKWTGDKETLGPRGPVSQVSNWVVEQTRKVPITWAYQLRTGFANRPVSLGPSDLTDEVSKGPVMLLITRRYFPSSYSPFYAQVKELAIDYFNCNKSENVTKLRKTIHKINSEWITFWNTLAKVCPSAHNPSNSSLHQICQPVEKQIAHWVKKRHTLRRESLADYEEVSKRMNFTGFSCAFGRKFKFLAIDPTDMPHFVDLAFGGLGYGDDSDPVLFIIDAKNDLILPFTKFNISELAEIIQNYTLDIESKGFSSTYKSAHWNWRGSDLDLNVPLASQLDDQDSSLSLIKNIIGEFNQRDDLTEPSLAPNKLNLVLTLSSSDFEKFLNYQHPFHENTSMFLMLTAKFCGQCGVVLNSFLELSRLINEDYGHILNITFAKLDMVRNSLSTDFGDKLPTFIFMPGTRRHEFRLFPENHKVTSKTLLRFLLSEIDVESRIEMSLSSPGCRSCKSDENTLRIKRLQRACLAGNFSSTDSWKDKCINSNRLKVSEKLQLILSKMSQSAGEMETDQGDIFVGDVSKLLELDHLRHLKINLDTV